MVLFTMNLLKRIVLWSHLLKAWSKYLTKGFYLKGSRLAPKAFYCLSDIVYKSKDFLEGVKSYAIASAHANALTAFALNTMFDIVEAATTSG